MTADCLSDAKLLLSEAVSNVAHHTNAHSLDLTVVHADRHLTITVAERGATPCLDNGWVTGASMPTSTATTGRGLATLDALAHRWGITRLHRTSQVWFTLRNV